MVDFVDYNRGKVGALHYNRGKVEPRCPDAPMPRYHDALANWAKGQGRWRGTQSRPPQNQAVSRYDLSKSDIVKIVTIHQVFTKLDPVKIKVLEEAARPTRY